MIEDLIGKLYKDGGRGPTFFDCWGLSMEVHKRFDIDLPDFAISAKDVKDINDEIECQINLEGVWMTIDKPVIPCIVLIKTHPIFTQHVGTYIGNGNFIHISSTFSACIDRINNPLFKKRIKGFYKYVG